GDDAYRRPLDRLIGVGAGEPRIEALHRRRFRDVQRLALRNAFRDVEQDDVAQFLEADKVSEGAADLASTDQCNLIPRHVGKCPSRGNPGAPIALSRRPFKPAAWPARPAPLEHDPEKWIPVFGKACPRARPEGSCSNNKVERDGDSKKSHLALRFDDAADGV